MSCIIYSKSYKIEPNIYSNIKFNKSNGKHTLDDLLKCQHNLTNITNQGCGFFLIFNDTPYVITCNHVVGLKEIKTFCLGLNKSNKCETIILSIEKRIPELDIIILKFENENQKQNFDFYTVNQLDVKIDFVVDRINNSIDNNSIDNNSIDNNLFLKMLLFSDQSENKIIEDRMFIKNIKIEHEDFIGHIIPKIPLLTSLINDEENENKIDNDELPGFSGSLLLYNNMPIGMLACLNINKRKLQMLPMSLILKIVTINLTNQKEQNMYGFNIPTLTVRVELNNSIDNENEFIGKIVKLQQKYNTINTINTINIINEPTSYQIMNSNKKFKFLENDVIIKIGDIKINTDGTIYNNDIGTNITVDTHMMLECYSNLKNNCEFTIIREENEIEKCIKINIVAKSLNTLYHTKIFNDHVYANWNGFVFAELSEELVNNISKLFNFEIKGSIIESPKMTIGDKKIVVVIDIDNDLIPKKYKNIFFVDDNLLTPLFHTNIGKQLLIVEKIGNKMISSIDDIMSAIKNKNTKSISLIYEENGNFIKI